MRRFVAFNQFTLLVVFLVRLHGSKFKLRQTDEASRFLFQSGKYYIQLSGHYVSHKNRKFRYACMYLLIRKGQIAQKIQYWGFTYRIY